MSNQDGNFHFDAIVPEVASSAWVVLADAGNPSVVLQTLSFGSTPVIVSSISTLIVNEMEIRGLSASEATLMTLSTLGLSATAKLNSDFSTPTTNDEQSLKNVAQAAFLVMEHINAGLRKIEAGPANRTLHLASWTEALPVTAYLVQQLELTQPHVDNLIQNVSDTLASAFSRDLYADSNYSSGILLNASANLSSASSILGKQWQTVRDLGPTEFDLTCCYLGVGSLDFANGLIYNRSAYVKGQWRAQPDYMLDLFDLNTSSGTWVRRPVYGYIGSLNMQQPGIASFTASHSGWVSHYSFREADISGKSLASVQEIYQGITQFSGGSSSQPPASLIFPAGSKIIYMSAIPATDNYTLGNARALARGAGAPALFSSVDEMLAFAQTPSTSPIEPGTLPHIIAGVYAITFDSMADEGSLTFWDAKTVYNPNGGREILGRGQYETRTIAGKKILVITHTPLNAIAYGCTTCLPPPSNERIIFAFREDSIWLGTMELANHFRTPSFWPNVKMWVDKSFTPMLNTQAWEALKVWLNASE